MRSLSCLGLLSLLSLAAGCGFWGEDHGKQRYYTYCDQTGCYTCTSEGCAPTGGAPNGACRTASDCAQGCYCDPKSSTCQEAGFCDQQADCAKGMVCNVKRHSCEPDAPPPQACKLDAECPAGQLCVNGACTTPPPKCSKDSDCTAGQTCVNGACTATPPPKCAADAD